MEIPLCQKAKNMYFIVFTHTEKETLLLVQMMSEVDLTLIGPYSLY